MMSRLVELVSVLVFLSQTIAHVTMWHPSAYGYDALNPNQEDLVNPLYNLTFDQWWFHGNISNPPADGEMLILPAGGTLNGELGCNKALTSYGDPNNPLRKVPYACDTIGPLHTTDTYGSSNPTDVKGCALSIAYKSDVYSITTEDFVVISVIYQCPWEKNITFHIPPDLPPCPPGGCHCAWHWVHSQLSGGEQIYFNGYKCNVTDTTNTVPLPPGKTANKCDYPTDTSNCTVGPRFPHYWLQKEQNNNFQDYYDPPFYNNEYGFMDGAQTDLYNTSDVKPNSGGGGSTPPVMSNDTMSSSTSASQATHTGGMSPGGGGGTSSMTSVSPGTTGGSNDIATGNITSGSGGQGGNGGNGGGSKEKGAKTCKRRNVISTSFRV